jgi:hypothetical protein
MDNFVNLDYFIYEADENGNTVATPASVWINLNHVACVQNNLLVLDVWREGGTSGTYVLTDESLQKLEKALDKQSRVLHS